MTITLRDQLKDQLAAKRAEVEKLEATIGQLDQMKYQNELKQRVQRLAGRNWVAEEPRYQGEANYILPLGPGYDKVNPTRPEQYPFGGTDWVAGDVAYIMAKDERTRPTRIIVGYGGGNPDWDIGNTWTLRHDQTNAKLGDYKVVGVVVYGVDGQVVTEVGEVPDRKLAVAVFK